MNDYLYVILFESSVIKVGRTYNFKKRLYQHRTSSKEKHGEIIDSFSRKCKNITEKDVIDFCNGNSSKRIDEEWFIGADFNAVKSFIDNDFISLQNKDSALKESNYAVNLLQIMIRELAGNPIRQNHKTLMFSANDMAKLFPSKNMDNWVNSKGTHEFVETIKLRESLVDDEVIYRSGKKRGDDSGTWVHPLMAVDLAMWLDSNFKYDVLKWVQDHLCQNRDTAGNSYKTMTDAIQSSYGNECHFTVYVNECHMVQSLAGVKTGKRNEATEEQLKLLSQLENWNAKLLNKGVKQLLDRRLRLAEFIEMNA